ncbi:MAG: TMEM175 family protein [Methanoregula sp.]|nr:TMEM175 family protein [Methanoregula sp.]
MSNLGQGEEGFISKNRLETLVDSVFAFAMTLLVVSLAIPTIPDSQAAAALPVYIAGMYSEFVSFLLAFLLLAIFWIVHHRNFHYLHSIDSGVLWLNIGILICIVLVPFTTSVSGDYSDVQIAIVLFHLNLLAIGIFFAAHWYYITHTPRLIEPAISERAARCGSRRSMVTPVVALIGIAISFFTPGNSMLAYLLIPPGIYLVGRYWCR